MKRNLILGLVLNLLLAAGVSASVVKNSRISAGAAAGFSGPIKSIGIGGLSGRHKQIKAAEPVSVKPAVSPLSPEFILGEVYVSPNPAKGGAAPVFHIETGIADSVNIKIHTVSGMLAHECSITGMPKVYDKGGASVYAYEYIWAGNIPGLYYYTIEAERSGKKLAKSGMFAVTK
ncbi:MAG: hypothetical protein WCW52_07195 [Elusimicrobiales bacterium]|jgi:hypothetical protein